MTVFYRGFKSKGRFIRLNAKGFILVETIVVVGIAVLSVIGVIKKSDREVCQIRMLNLMYESQLDLADIEHSDVFFVHYLQDYVEDICSEYGLIG